MVLAVVLVIAAGVGVLYRRRSGRLRDGAAVRLTVDDLGAPLGELATLVHFSTTFCQPCRATRSVLGRVATMVEGVAHVEIDAEANLGLVRRLGVLRTPTVLVLDAGGKITRRASGQPRTSEVIAAVGALTSTVHGSRRP